MKKILTLFAALVLLAVGATAQKLSYSAVVRNSDNELVANENVTVVISIANSATGDAVYSETHSGLQTNQNGLLTLVIGDGTPSTGSMSAVTWQTAFITTDITLPGDVHVLNTTPVMAVPYALYADNAGNGGGGSGTYTETDPVFTAWNKDYNDLTNTPPIPTVNNGTLTIKQGDNTLGTFTANQPGATEVNIPSSTFTEDDLISMINGMSSDKKAALCEALTNLGCSGGSTPTPTPFVNCGDKVYDHQGNGYNTVQIGDQCWTKENMRCTTSPKEILTVGSGLSENQPYYYDNTNNSYNYNIPFVNRGLYYNWAAAMDTVFATTDDLNVSFEGRRGICPENWHVPSDAEWTTLTTYVSNNYTCDGISSYNAKALAINKNYWSGVASATESNHCEPRYNPVTTNNATDFSAVPSGYWYYGFEYAGSYVYFWSSSSKDSSIAWIRSLGNIDEKVGRHGFGKSRGFPVRCLKDE